MAIPTITSITPTTGSAIGGALVVITGTNFRTRSVTYEVPQAAENATVSVRFGTVEAEAWAESTTHVLALVPQYLGSAELEAFVAVGITVENLDDDGNPIAGETVTIAAAFTYKRPDLAPPSPDPPLLQVLHAFIHIIKTGVCKNVTVQTHPDYADDGASYTVLTQLPVMVFDKIRIPRDKEYNQWDNERQVHNGQLWNAPQTHMLVADFILAAEFENVAYRMHDALIELVRTQPYLYVPGDVRWSTDANEYPLEMSQEPEQISQAGRSGVFSFFGQLQVRGIPLVPTQPIGNVYTIATLVCALSDMTGSSFYIHSSP